MHTLSRIQKFGAPSSKFSGIASISILGNVLTSNIPQGVNGINYWRDAISRLMNAQGWRIEQLALAPIAFDRDYFFYTAIVTGSSTDNLNAVATNFQKALTRAGYQADNARAFFTNPVSNIPTPSNIPTTSNTPQNTSVVFCEGQTSPEKNFRYKWNTKTGKCELVKTDAFENWFGTLGIGLTAGILLAVGAGIILTKK